MRALSSSVVMLLLSASTAGCRVDAVTPHRHVRYVVFADASMSITAKQADDWCHDAETLVFTRLQFGDAVDVYPLSDHTGEVAPKSWSVSAFDEGEGMEAETRVKTQLQAAKDEGLKATCAILKSPQRSRKTLIIPAFGRVHPDAEGREIRIILLTDALESGKDLDLERTLLTDSNTIPLATAALNRERLRSNCLNGVAVQFVLDSPEMGRPVLNARSRLESFWRPMIEALGGTLTRFDSAIS